MPMVLLAGSNISVGIANGLEQLKITAELFANGRALPDLERFSAVYFTGGFPTLSEECKNTAKEICKQCAELSIPVVFDPELDKISPDKYCVIKEIAALGVVFVPSIEECAALCGKDEPESAANALLETGVSKIVIKLDKKGAYFKSTKEFGYAPTFRADNVVDTRGAGTAFAVGLISGLTEEIPLSEAVVRANACGCIAIQTEGETDLCITADKLRDYMLNHRFVVEECKLY